MGWSLPSSTPSPHSARRSTHCCAPTSPVGAPAPGAPSASCCTAPRSALVGGQPQPKSPATWPPGAGPPLAMGPGDGDRKLGMVREQPSLLWGHSVPSWRSPYTPPSSLGFISQADDQVTSRGPQPGSLCSLTPWRQVGTSQPPTSIPQERGRHWVILMAEGTVWCPPAL